MHNAHTLKIAVNVSSQQLCRPRLVHDTEFMLNETGLDPQLLALEVSESSLIGNIAKTIATLERLKTTGVHLEIDDFGTRYSSLTYLRRLPFDTLKIDGSFIRELAGADGRDMVRAIVEMARSLHLDIIAEGFKSEQQLRELRRLGRNIVHGFLFSGPVETAAVPNLLAEGIFAHDYGAELLPGL